MSAGVIDAAIDAVREAVRGEDGSGEDGSGEDGSGDVRNVSCMAGVTRQSGVVLNVLRVQPLCIIQQITSDGAEERRVVLESDAEIDWLVRSLKLLRQQ